MPNEIFKTKALKSRLAIFVAVNVLLIIVSQLLIFNYAQRINDNQVINLAGRQRMLSQTIAKRVYLFNITGADTLGYNAYMLSFQKVHAGLLNGEKELALKKVIGAKLVNEFEDVDAIYNNFYTTAEIIINKKHTNDKEKDGYVALFSKYDSLFLAKMNAFVFNLTNDAQQKRKNVLILEIIVNLALIVFAILQYKFFVGKLLRKNAQIAENISFYAALQYVHIAQEQHASMSKLLHDELAPDLLTALLYLKAITPNAEQVPYFNKATTTISDVVANLKKLALNNHVNDNDFENFSFAEGISMQCTVIDYAMPKINIMVNDEAINKTYKILLLNFIKNFLLTSKPLAIHKCQLITLTLIANHYLITFSFIGNSFNANAITQLLNSHKLNSLIILLKGFFKHSIMEANDVFEIKIPLKLIEF